MIKAVIKKNKAGSVCGFEIRGHAEYAKSGQDIVCAAVSMLVINTINSLEQFTDDDIDVFTDEEAGVIKCMVSHEKSKKLSLEADVLLKAMILGLESAKNQYGKYIELSEECYKC